MLDRSPVNRRRVARLGMTALLWATAVTAQSTTDLIQAVKAGRPDAVRTLLDHGADPNSPQGDGATALHHAAHRNDLEAARLLTEAGADVTAANELGATPLWLAARNGSAAMVSHLLEAGADANAPLTMGETPLMTAARAGDLDTVRLLLAHGADVEATERDRRQTALMWAVAQGHAAVAQVLIEHGADVGALVDPALFGGYGEQCFFAHRGRCSHPGSERGLTLDGFWIFLDIFERKKLKLPKTSKKLGWSLGFFRRASRRSSRKKY